MTPEQMNELAARLREHAHLHRTYLPQDNEQKQWTADLDAAANLIESMAQQPIAATLFLSTPSDRPVVTGWNENLLKAGDEIAVYLAPPVAQPPTLIPAHVRDIERAIDEAVNPRGMSVHDGKAKIDAALLQRLLAIARLSAQRVPLTEQQIWDAVEHGAIGGIGLVSKAVKVARAIEQAHGIRSEK